jgi:hypothetical protein
MKKRISLLLAVVMILGSFSFAFAANDEVDPGKFLEQEGVFKGDTTGDLMLDKPLERRDSVILLSRLFGVEKEAKEFKEEGLPTWKDNNDGNYTGYLAWAQSNKYFEGHSETKFGPRETIKVRDYAVVLLRALKEDDTWKTAYETAKKAGILEGVEKEADAEVLRGDAAQMTFNALGLTVKGENKTLAEKLGIKMPAAAKLEAKVEDTENLKEVIVKLSNAKLADKEKLENTTNYRLAGNEIERVEVKDNDVLVQVKEALRNGKQYELQIKGVDKAIDAKYKFVAKDNTIPAVEKVEALGAYGIKVVTTEPIDAARSKNFEVDGKNVTMDVEQYGRTIILTPYNGSFSDKAETLTIKELKDFAGFKSEKEDFEIEIVKDEVAPQVTDVLLKGNKVVVVFDKDIYGDTVEAYWNRSNVGNISYELGRHTIYASEADKIDVNKVAYTFKDNEVPSRRDKLTIEGVANHSNVKMEKTSMIAREVIDDSEPEMIDKKVVAKDFDKNTATIKLYFNKNVSGSFIDKAKEEKGFVVKDHFTLYEDEVSNRNISDGRVVSAEYDYDAKKDEVLKDVIVVKLDNLEKYDRKTNDLEYILEVEGFVDASSARNKMYRDYYEFKFNVVNDLAVTKVAIDKGSKDTEITLSFNNYLDREIAEKATNYVFYKVNSKGEKVSSDDIADLDGEAELIGNGTKVLLTIPKSWADLKYDYAGLKILDVIKDTNGNRLGKTYYVNLKSEAIEEEEITIDEVARLIKALPKLTEINDENLEEVAKQAKEARDAFAKLDEDQQKLLAETEKVLKAVEAKIEELKAEKQTLDEAVEALEKAVKGFEVNNDVTEAKILEEANKVISGKGIEAERINDFKIVKAEVNKAGKVTGKIIVSQTASNGTVTSKPVAFEIEIEALPAPVVDKTELNAEITKLENALKEADKYTDESVEAANKVLTAAKAVAAKDATQAEVDEQVAALKAVELVEKTATEEVTATYVAGEKLLGITTYSITVEGAEVSAVEKVIVNGEKVEVEKTAGTIDFNYHTTIETVQIVIGEKTVDVTLAK